MKIITNLSTPVTVKPGDKINLKGDIFMNNKVKPGYKWAVYALFNRDTRNVKDRNTDLTDNYYEFKKRILQSIPGVKESDFYDKNLSFYKVISKPSDVFVYFYALNPLPGDDILDGAKVKIERIWTYTPGMNKPPKEKKEKGRYPWGKRPDTTITNETAAIVEGGENNGTHE